MYLLNLDVLLAMVDPRHEAHQRVMDWMYEHDYPALATCPCVENSFLQLFGHQNYPNGPGSPWRAVLPLKAIKMRPDYRFIPDVVSIADSRRRMEHHHPEPSELNLYYLLRLAKLNDVKLLCLDVPNMLEHWEDLPEFAEVIR